MSVSHGQLKYPLLVTRGDEVQLLEHLPGIKLPWKDHTYGGADGKRLMDKNVRCCRTPTQKWDAALFQKDWLVISNHFEAGTRFVTQDILLYEHGGKFAEHVDRNRPRKAYRHVGTLVIVAPNPGTKGGDLFVEGKALLRGGASSYRWAFIPLGVLHEVTEIVAGSGRIALTFGVYTPLKPPTELAPKRPRSQSLSAANMAFRVRRAAVTGRRLKD